jgi:hypothetical protein
VTPPQYGFLLVHIALRLDAVVCSSPGSRMHFPEQREMG